MRAILLLLGFGALGVIGLGLAGWWWWSQHGTEFQSNITDGVKQGTEFGKGSDSEGCLQEGFERIRRDPQTEIGLSNHMFLVGCLMITKPSPDFCKGVPPSWNQFAVSRWAKQRCESEALSDTGCVGMLSAVADHCSSAALAEDPDEG
jgi:hypothetical protein